jgi:hypothetical protein
MLGNVWVRTLYKLFTWKCIPNIALLLPLVKQQKNKNKIVALSSILFAWRLATVNWYMPRINAASVLLNDPPIIFAKSSRVY